MVAQSKTLVLTAFRILLQNSYQKVHNSRFLLSLLNIFRFMTSIDVYRCPFFGFLNMLLDTW
jgi:hypothetical protein